jgi:hypothetical protein
MDPPSKIILLCKSSKSTPVPLGRVAALAAEGVLGECDGTLYVVNPPGRAAPTCAPPVYLLSISTGALTYVGSLMRFVVIVLLHFKLCITMGLCWKDTCSGGLMTLRENLGS